MAFGINPGSADKMTQFLSAAKAQNSTAANGTANGLNASNSTSGGNAAGGQNGLPPSSAIASPTATPLTNLVPGNGQSDAGGAGSGGAGSGGAGSGGSSDGGSGSGSGANSDAQDACTCNCLCDLGQPGMGGLVGSIPLPSTGAMGSKRNVRF
jgi:hypothetical protein